MAWRFGLRAFGCLGVSVSDLPKDASERHVLGLVLSASKSLRALGSGVQDLVQNRSKVSDFI